MQNQTKVLLYCCDYVWFPAQRSTHVSIYFRTSSITSLINKDNINLDDATSWSNVSTLDGYGLVGIVQLSHPQQARYVAVKRNGYINLKEVQIYQRPREFSCRLYATLLFDKMVRSHNPRPLGIWLILTVIDQIQVFNLYGLKIWRKWLLLDLYGPDWSFLNSFCICGPNLKSLRLPCRKL